MQIVAVIRYQFRLLRKEQLWAPLGILFFFAISAALLHDGPGGADLFHGTLALVPLVIAALGPSLLTDDPAFELRAATPFPRWQYVATRVVGLLLAAAAFAGALWVVAVATGAAGPFVRLGWVTIVPSIALASLSSFAGAATRRSVIGIAICAGVWLFQVFYGALLLVSETGKLFHLWIGLKLGVGPSFWANHVALAGVGVLLFAATAFLLRREDRFLD